jgi:predicted ATPase
MAQDPMAPDKHNLPQRRKRFIGRSGEMSRLDTYLRESPLVTITGTGGLGKTRLALNYGASADGFERVILIDLAKARTLDHFLSGVQDALQPNPDADADPDSGRIVQLGQTLAGLGNVLIIVDNLEQVVDPAAHAIGRWIELAPNVSFLATSREPLHLRGEHHLRLAPLSEDEAIELFEHRASQVRPEFVLDKANRAAVADIVDFLDAVPLAVELAAARVNVIAPVDILARLTGEGGGLHTLIRKTRLATVRHQSMHATLYWSWELIGDDERQVLSGASVFRGGFDLPAAEAVLKTGDSLWTGDVLESLVDKSLVMTGRAPGPNARAARRFRLLETTREFADGMLSEERRTELKRRHAKYFADRLAESKRLRRAEDVANVEEGFWSSVGQDDDLAARLAMGAYRMRRARDGYTSEQLEIVDAALDAMVEPGSNSTRSHDPKLQAKLLGARARCLYVEGRYTEAISDAEAGLVLAVEIDATARQAHLLYRKATVLRAAGRLQAAREPLDQALALAEGLSDTHALTRMRQFGGKISFDRGHFEQASREFSQALELARRHGYERLEARTLVDLGRCQVPIGELESAELRLDEAQSIDRAATVRFEMVWLEALGVLEWYRGRNTPAFEAFQKALGHADDEAWSQTGAGRRLNPVRFGLSALDAAADDTPPEDYLRAILRSIWSTEDVAERVQARTRLAMIHLRRREFREAARLMRQATDEVDRVEFGSIRTHVRCWASVAEAAAGRRERAEQLLEQARTDHDDEQARELSDDIAYFLRAGEWLAGRSMDAGKRLDDIIDDLRTRAKERRFQPNARIWRWVCYDHLLELAALFEQAVTEVSPSTGLAVARDATAFRLPDGEHVDLSSRQALSLILAEMAHRRDADNHQGISVDELSSVGWPDEKITESAGSSRVYTAIRTLRTLGLDDILLTGRDGYMLDPDLAFDWLD